MPLIEIKISIAELLEKTKENPFRLFGPKPRPYPEVVMVEKAVEIEDAKAKQQRLR